MIKENYPGNVNSLGLWDSLNKKAFFNSIKIENAHISTNHGTIKRPANFQEIQNQNPNFNYVWGDESFDELFVKLNKNINKNDRLVYAMLIVTCQHAFNDVLVARKCIKKLIDYDKEVYKSIPKTMLEQLDLKPLNKWKFW